MVEGWLADGRPFLLGQAAGLADFSIFHPFWMLNRAGRKNAALLEPFSEHPRLARPDRRLRHGVADRTGCAGGAGYRQIRRPGRSGRERARRCRAGPWADGLGAGGGPGARSGGRRGRHRAAQRSRRPARGRPGRHRPQPFPALRLHHPPGVSERRALPVISTGANRRFAERRNLSGTALRPVHSRGKDISASQSSRPLRSI